MKWLETSHVGRKNGKGCLNDPDKQIKLGLTEEFLIKRRFFLLFHSFNDQARDYIRHNLTSV